MKTILKLAFAAGILASASPSFSQLYIGLGVRVGPPSPRAEVVPARPPHRGWVWVAGYYEWKPGPHRYIWMRGHWARPPHPHDVWVAGRWEQRHGEWVFNEGRWEGDHHHVDRPREESRHRN